MPNRKEVEYTQMAIIGGQLKEKTWIITLEEFARDFPDYVDELKIRGRTGDAIGEGVSFCARLTTIRDDPAPGSTPKPSKGASQRASKAFLFIGMVYRT